MASSEVPSLKRKREDRNSPSPEPASLLPSIYRSRFERFFVLFVGVREDDDPVGLDWNCGDGRKPKRSRFVYKISPESFLFAASTAGKQFGVGCVARLGWDNDPAFEVDFTDEVGIRKFVESLEEGTFCAQFQTLLLQRLRRKAIAVANAELFLVLPRGEDKVELKEVTKDNCSHCLDCVLEGNKFDYDGARTVKQVSTVDKELDSNEDLNPVFERLQDGVVKWDLLGRCLGLDQVSLTRIDLDYQDIPNKLLRMLLAWLRKGKATWSGDSGLLNALCKADHRRLAEEIIRKEGWVIKLPDPSQVCEELQRSSDGFLKSLGTAYLLGNKKEVTEGLEKLEQMERKVQEAKEREEKLSAELGRVKGELQRVNCTVTELLVERTETEKLGKRKQREKKELKHLKENANDLEAFAFIVNDIDNEIDKIDEKLEVLKIAQERNEAKMRKLNEEMKEKEEKLEECKEQRIRAETERDVYKEFVDKLLDKQPPGRKSAPPPPADLPQGPQGPEPPSDDPLNPPYNPGDTDDPPDRSSDEKDTDQNSDHDESPEDVHKKCGEEQTKLQEQIKQLERELEAKRKAECESSSPNRIVLCMSGSELQSLAQEINKLLSNTS